MANAENIRKVIEMIKDEQNYFDMSTWNRMGDVNINYPPNVCGTPACIGGWSEAIIKHELKIAQDPDFFDYLDEAVIAEWLGIMPEDAEELFYGIGTIATREEAIAHLEHIIETDEVNWSLFLEKAE